MARIPRLHSPISLNSLLGLPGLTVHFIMTWFSIASKLNWRFSKAAEYMKHLALKCRKHVSFSLNFERSRTRDWWAYSSSELAHLQNLLMGQVPAFVVRWSACWLHERDYLHTMSSVLFTLSKSLEISLNTMKNENVFFLNKNFITTWKENDFFVVGRKAGTTDWKIEQLIPWKPDNIFSPEMKRKVLQ